MGTKRPTKRGAAKVAQRSFSKTKQSVAPKSKAKVINGPEESRPGPGTLPEYFPQNDYSLRPLTDAQCIERLHITAWERGDYMIRMFIAAVDREVAIPHEVLQSLAEAMKCLVQDEPLALRMRKFVKCMSLSSPAGRPKHDIPETAFEYWTARHQGYSRAEALEIAAAKTDKDVRTIERDVKNNPDIEDLAREILRIVRAHPTERDKN